MTDTPDTLYRKFANAREIENPPEGAILCWVVPVERCEHGNYARHIVITSVRILDGKSLWKWCDGQAKQRKGHLSNDAVDQMIEDRESAGF